MTSQSNLNCFYRTITWFFLQISCIRKENKNNISVYNQLDIIEVGSGWKCLFLGIMLCRMITNVLTIDSKLAKSSLLPGYCPLSSRLLGKWLKGDPKWRQLLGKWLKGDLKCRQLLGKMNRRRLLGKWLKGDPKQMCKLACKCSATAGVMWLRNENTFLLQIWSLVQPF